MKKYFWIIVVTLLVALVGLLLPGCSGSTQPTQSSQPKQTAAKSAPIKLRLATAHVTTMGTVQAVMFFKDKIEKASNGRIQLQVYPGGELFAHGDAPRVIPTGEIEMFLTEAGHWASVGEIFNYQGMMMLCANLDNVLKNMTAYSEILDKAWQEKNTKLIFTTFNAPQCFNNNKRLIKVPADIKGLSIRAPTAGIRTCIEMLGGMGSSIAVDEVYDAVAKGTIDGSVTGTESVWTRGFYEVTKFNSAPINIERWLVIMNLDVWKALSPDDQKIIKDAAAEAQAFSIADVDKRDKDTQQKIIGKGSQFHTFTADELAQWNQALKPVYQKWLDACTKQGHGADAQWFFKTSGISF